MWRILNKMGSWLITITVVTSIAAPLFAHGGEDHGEQAPKSTATSKGVVVHTSRLGDLEVTLKHPLLVPDQSTQARLFLTKFTSNDPFADAEVKVELESATGVVNAVSLEKDKHPGAYLARLPALVEGSYKIRVGVSYRGETDTTTFSGVEVKPLRGAEQLASSWFSLALLTISFLVVITVLGGLLYFAWVYAARGTTSEEALPT
jgi:hypothetical protein